MPLAMRCPWLLTLAVPLAVPTETWEQDGSAAWGWQQPPSICCSGKAVKPQGFAGITFKTLPDAAVSWERRFSRWVVARSSCLEDDVAGLPRSFPLPGAVLDTELGPAVAELGHGWLERSP